MLVWQGALAAFVLVGVLGVASDVDRHESEPRPKPAGLGRQIDQGDFGDARLKGYFTPEGFRLEIVATEPQVINPVGMTFDEGGTPHVLEWMPGAVDWPEFKETITYKDGSTRPIITMKKNVKDVVKRLVDADGDGRYEKAEKTGEAELPSSILFHEGAQYLTGRGYVFRNGAKIAQGFCGFHHHQVSGLTIGNDGWLYLTSGDNDNFVEGSDGSRATVLRTGAVFRSRPDGSKMQVWAEGFRNPYRDVAFDAFYNMFHADNDNEDGTKFMGCRLMHVAEGADFGWRLRPGAPCCAADHFRGSAFGEHPGRMTPMLKTGRGSPAGLLIYNDSFFPERYRGLLYYPDVFRKSIRAYRTAPDGASFKVTEEFELLKSDDELFRPAQMVTGPDGAIYIVDWRTNSGGAGKLWGDGKHGRLYRLKWDGTRLRSLNSWAEIAKQTPAKLVETLSSANQTDRERARMALVRGGHFAELLGVLKNKRANVYARVAALGGVQSKWSPETEAAVVETLTDDSADLRRLAADALALNGKAGDDGLTKLLSARLSDPDPKARRAAALAVGRIGGAGAADALYAALLTEDRYLFDGVVRALERLGKRGIDKLVAEQAVKPFLSLKTRDGVEALPKMIAATRDDASRAALVRSYRNYILDPPIDPSPSLLAYLKANPRETPAVTLAALDVMGQHGGLKGAEVGNFLMTLVDRSDPELTVAALRAIQTSNVTDTASALSTRLEGTRPAATRVAILETLAKLGDKRVAGVLAPIVKSGAESEVRTEALRTLAALDAPAALALAKELLSEKDHALLSEAVRTLGNTKDGARQVGQLYLDRKLPRELMSVVLESLRKHTAGDTALAAMVTDVLKQGLLVGSNVKELETKVATQGSPLRGRALYLNGPRTMCVGCHKLEGVGGNVGPDLTRVWETHTLPKLIETILEPSKEIKEGYQSFDVTLADGRKLSGLIVARTKADLTLREANGKETKITNDNLDGEPRASRLSLMPEGILAGLSEQEFVDLLAFLRNRAAQESLARVALEWHVKGPFDADAKAAHPPERNAVPGEGWKAVLAEPDGLLNLRAVFNADNISAYALTYIDSPVRQAAKLVLGSDDGVRVWLNGTQVHENIVMRGAAPEQDSVDVMLAQGRNVLLVRVFNGTLAHGLYLRVDGGRGVVVKPR